MKMRWMFGLLTRQQNFAQMKQHIESGDTIVYEVDGEVKRATVQMVNDAWLFVQGDECVAYSSVLEWLL
jgi:pentose-5-phosphate-3-epimerase